MNRTEFEATVEKNYKHNLLYNVLDGTFFWFGYSFITPTIIFPLYVSHFTDSSVLIGLIAFINSFCVLVPELFTANWVARKPIKKFFPVKVGFFAERLPIFLLAPSVILFASVSPTLALVSFFLLFSWHCTGAGVIMVGWQDMLAKVFPMDRRGRFYGLANFGGTATGILGALAVTWLLAVYPFPRGYALSFGAAGVLVLFSWFALAQTREPPQASSQPAVSQIEYFRSLPALLRKDSNFTRYLVSQIVISIAGMATSFIVVYATRRWNLPDSQAGQFTVATLVGQAVANLGFGWLADRKGHKLVLELSALFLLAAYALTTLATGPYWFYVIFTLRGASFAGFLLSGIMIAMEFSHAELRPTYLGLSNTIPGIAAGIAPLFAGWLAGWLDFRWVFTLSGAFALTAFILLRWVVREPRHLPNAIPETAISEEVE